MSRHSLGEGDHFEQLPNLVRAVCSDEGVALSDLAQVRVGTGPGSFTGLRIGMSFAKGLSWCLRIPCEGVCSFLGAASAQVGSGMADGRVTVIADARRLEVFCGLYEISAGKVSVVSKPEILKLEDVVKRAGQGGRHVTPQRDFVVPGIELHTTAHVALGLLGVKGASGAFSVGDIAYLEPSYLREVSAKTIEERRRGA